MKAGRKEVRDAVRAAPKGTTLTKQDCAPDIYALVFFAGVVFFPTPVVVTVFFFATG
jgi:hypothetical protein